MTPFPPIDLRETGFLDTADGHRVWYGCSGAPDGVPALLLHGGPGGSSPSGHRRFFDPARWRIVAFDQRGCGRSRPLASDPAHGLATNTTPHLIGDIEALRLRLGVDAWGAVVGVSWGTTLALAYAHAHRERVRGLVLGLVGTGSRREVDWMTVGVGRLFPREWDAFVAAIPEDLRGLRPVDAYARLLADPATAEDAARAWGDWEDAHVSLTPGARPTHGTADPAFRLGFARLVTHYWRHDCFLDDGVLLRDAAYLDGVPGVLICGRWDVSSPLETAWTLAKRWRGSRLVVLDGAGHGGEGFPEAMTEAVSSLGPGEAGRSP
jgi:proline iminopeptidase